MWVYQYSHLQAKDMQGRMYNRTKINIDFLLGLFRKVLNDIH